MKQMMRNRSMYFVVFCLLVCWIVSNNCRATDTSYRPSLKSWMFSPIEIRHYKGTLRAKGYDVNSVEEIKRATKDDKSIVRINALLLLSHRIERESIPTLKNALNDSRPIVRCTAARLLGIFGDRSGLDTMRKDMLEFTKEDWEKDQAEKDPKTSQKDIPLSLRMKGGRLLHALQAAQVLAEFGDVSGYELAAKSAMDGEPAHKSAAIAILSEIGRLDKSTLKDKGCDPEAIFISVAEKETDHKILECLFACVLTNMRPEPTIRILEKVQNSPHLTDKQRQRVKSGLKSTKERLEQEKQARKENKK